MSTSAAAPNGSDVVLAELVEEFTNRLNAGEPVDVESCIRRHPEHAGRIRQLLPALELLAELGHSSNAGSDAAASDIEGDRVSGTLGDFRLLREVGKGGMGVVYEAEQVSLRRRVALKVLPFAATMDPRYLQRFQNEAQAAACLHHTNIVPVYFVGVERGVHFYAMQFIDGQPLSELIHQLRQAEKTIPPSGEEQTTAYQGSPGERITTTPTVHAADQSTPLIGEGKRGRDYFRKVAELGVQAAEALDHAHQLGIVHRDIKPGNLMLDGRGNLWVTDFGLAHMRHGETNLTVTGQLVGTPRYMSPEQALTQRVPIDHRTDVYSLGATLYELLTLRPVFEADDRQELLRQIAFEDPARPRRLERAIPTELEIIVLKAMEKRPQDRYATAKDLADDLRRWLLDQPIRARRPTLVQRAAKWQRRHRTVVLAAVLVLLIAVIALAASTVLINAAYRGEAFQRGQAERERDLAGLHLYVAQTRLAQSFRDNKRFTRLKDLLAEQVPLPGKPDLRGWEWYHLQALCSRDLLTVGDSQDGHKHFVSWTAWSPDGRFLATAQIPGDSGGFNHNMPQQIQIWDIAARQSIHTLSGHSQRVECLSYSPDGRLLAGAGWDRTIRIWDAATGKEAFVIRGHTGGVYAIGWSRDGRRLASAAADKTVRIWDAQTGKQLMALTSHTAAVTSVVWSPDSRKLVSAAMDGTARVWDAATGREVCTIQSDKAPICSVAWSPNGRHLVASEFNGPSARKDVPVWDATTGQEVLALRTGAQSLAAWSPDGKWLATSRNGYGPNIQVWDANKGEEVFSLASQDGPVGKPSWSPDGSRLLATGEKRFVAWDVLSRQELFSVSGVLAAMSWSPDGERILSVSQEDDDYDRLVQVWRASAGQDSILLRGHTGAVKGVAWCKDGKRLASASSDGTTKIWDATTGEDLLTLRNTSEWGMSAVAWSPDGKHLATGEGEAVNVAIKGRALVSGNPPHAHRPRIQLWEVATGREVRILPGQPGVTGLIGALAYSPDGRWLASADQKGLLKVWDVSTGMEYLLMDRGARSIHQSSMAFSPDSRLLVSGRTSGVDPHLQFEVVVWDVTTGQEVLSCKGHTSQVTGVAISPGGQLLASSSEAEVKIWDLANGQEMRSLGHPGSVFRLAFTPDGKRLATGTIRGIKLWDVATWQELLNIPIANPGGDSAALPLEFSSDGRRLVTWGPNNTVRVFDAEARPPCLFSEVRHPRHRQYLRNQHWLRGSALAREYHTQVAWYGSGAKGEPQRAERAYHQALELQRGLLNAAPGAADRRHELALLHLELGGLLVDNGRAGEAERSYDAAAELLRALVQDFPDVLVYQRNLGKAYKGLVPLYQAARRYLEMVQAWGGVVELTPDDHEQCNDFAWFLANTLDPQLRDARRAIDVAKKALDHCPDRGLRSRVISSWNRELGYRDTLGVAYYRACEWQAVIDTLESFLAELAKKTAVLYPTPPSTMFILAVAHWQLGHKEQGRKWYDRAVQWMDEHKKESQDEELRRFRAEAAAQLGIKDLPTTKGKEESPKKE